MEISVRVCLFALLFSVVCTFSSRAPFFFLGGVKKKVGIFHLIYHILFNFISFCCSFNSILLCWCCRLGGHAIFVNQNCTIWFTLICKAKINSYVYKWITCTIICLYLVGLCSLNAAGVDSRSMFGFFAHVFFTIVNRAFKYSKSVVGLEISLRHSLRHTH